MNDLNKIFWTVHVVSLFMFYFSILILILCLATGVSQSSIVKFDLNWYLYCIIVMGPYVIQLLF